MRIGVIIMENKTIERMKKLIEEKKNKGLEKINEQRAKKTIGQGLKAKGGHKKTGGVFDK